VRETLGPLTHRPLATTQTRSKCRCHKDYSQDQSPQVEANSRPAGGSAARGRHGKQGRGIESKCLLSKTLAYHEPTEEAYLDHKFFHFKNLWNQRTTSPSLVAPGGRTKRSPWQAATATSYRLPGPANSSQTEKTENPARVVEPVEMKIARTP
jgi:hypothetical protein